MKNKQTIFILLSVLIFGHNPLGIAQNDNCIQCEGGSVTGTNASTIGKNNTASGNNSFAGGYNNTASGSNSFAFGYGSNATQSTNIAMGNTAQATGIGAIAIGSYVKASAQNSYVIGSGTTTSYPLTNSTANSIALGVNSKKPTMLITKALNNNYTGKVAIGPITNPQTKLHIKADSNEDAGVYIEPSNKTTKKAFLYLFDMGHKLMVDPTGTMELNSNSGVMNFIGDHYCFGDAMDVKTRLYTKGSSSIYSNVKRIKNTETRDVDAPSYAIDFSNNGLVFRTAVGQPQRGSVINNWKETLFLFTDGKIGIGSKSTFIENKEDHSLKINSPENIRLSSLDIGLNAEHVTLNGKIGINTPNEVEDYALAVNGGIISTKVFIKEANQWPDYVFADDYSMPSLEELKSYLDENKHLPGIPSETDITKSGYDLHQMQCLMMEKIEELTRYILLLQEEIDSLKSSKTKVQVNFAYDANGNRITRSLTFEKIQDASTSPCTPKDIRYEIYPNPTGGQFTVFVKMTDSQRTARATLHTASGSLIENRMVQEGQNTFDLSAYSDGIYILNIITPDGSQSWKVIKQ